MSCIYENHFIEQFKNIAGVELNHDATSRRQGMFTTPDCVTERPEVN